MLLDWRYRPLEELSLSDNTTHRHNLALNINTSYEITPALGVEVRYKYQRQSNRQRDLQNEAMWNTRNRSEEHTSELPVTNAHIVCRLLLENKKNQTIT